MAHISGKAMIYSFNCHDIEIYFPVMRKYWVIFSILTVTSVTMCLLLNTVVKHQSFAYVSRDWYNIVQNHAMKRSGQSVPQAANEAEYAKEFVVTPRYEDKEIEAILNRTRDRIHRDIQKWCNLNVSNPAEGKEKPLCDCIPISLGKI